MATTTDIGRRTYVVRSVDRLGSPMGTSGGAHMRVAMLTGGGDCPGLNAVMRAVARKGERIYGDELIGFVDGWKGVLEARSVPLGVEQLRGTLPRGGTVIGSSRTNPYKVEGGAEQVHRTLADLEVDALVAI